MMQELSAIVGSRPQPEKVAGGFQFADGPAFSRRGYLLFTDGPSNRIMRHAGGQTSVFRENSNRASALTFRKASVILVSSLESTSSLVQK